MLTSLSVGDSGELLGEKFGLLSPDSKPVILRFDHVTTACPKACANAKYLIVKLSVGSFCKDKNPKVNTLLL